MLLTFLQTARWLLFRSVYQIAQATGPGFLGALAKPGIELLSPSVICLSNGFSIAASQALNLNSVSPQEFTINRYVFVTYSQNSNLE